MAGRERAATKIASRTGREDNELYLGMDIGTSGVKAVLVKEAGAIVATAARASMLHRLP